jgi:hypothetical protein
VLYTSSGSKEKIAEFLHKLERKRERERERERRRRRRRRRWCWRRT